MSLPEVDVDLLAGRLLLMKPHLDERGWRLLLGAEAKVLGRGGIKVVAAAVRAHPDTVAQGVRELDYPDGIPGRIRRPLVLWDVQARRTVRPVSPVKSSAASTSTSSPSRISPASSALASWSPIADCTSRRSGRAP